eukprot:UC1_evm1s1116
MGLFGVGLGGGYGTTTTSAAPVLPNSTSKATRAASEGHGSRGRGGAVAMAALATADVPARAAVSPRPNTPTLAVISDSSNPDLPVIDADVLEDLITAGSHVVVIDCRFPYEFEGGHIRGAYNLYTEDLVENFFFSRDGNPLLQRSCALIFHCEFSSKRGPRLCRHLRQLDRHVNELCYPALHYPELYILHHGYKAFWERHPARCTPNAYVKMVDDKEQCRKYFNLHRARRSSSLCATNAAAVHGIASPQTVLRLRQVLTIVAGVAHLSVLGIKTSWHGPTQVVIVTECLSAFAWLMSASLLRKAARKDKLSVTLGGFWILALARVIMELASFDSPHWPFAFLDDAGNDNNKRFTVLWLAVLAVRYVTVVSLCVSPLLRRPRRLERQGYSLLGDAEHGTINSALATTSTSQDNSLGGGDGGGGDGSSNSGNSGSTPQGTVGQRTGSAWARVALFSHLHALPLRWHLSRKTGEVLRMVDRGTTSVNQLLKYIVFNILPTLIDVGVAVAYFTAHFGAYLGLIVFTTMAAYIYATIALTEWRTKFRRDMNKGDNTCRQLAVDSLLNFETVKYCNGEKFERERYDKAIQSFLYASWQSLASLNLLNGVQGLIIGSGILGGAMLCADMVAMGDASVGDFVLFISYLVQLYTPLNYFGTYFRMIQAGLIDVENMLDLLDVPIESVDAEDAVDLELAIKKDNEKGYNSNNSGIATTAAKS